MKKAAKSLSQLNNQIWDAIRDKFAKEVSTRDVFPDEKYAIFVLGDTTHKVSYSIDDNENIVLGDDLTPVKLEREYIEIEGSFPASIVAAEEKTSPEYGYKWQVRVVNFGPDKNKLHWTKEPLVAALPEFEGAKVFMLSEAQHQNSHRYGKPPGQIIGWLSEVAVDAQGITAALNVLRTSLGAELRAALVDSWERGNPNLLGLSVDISGKAERRTVAGKSVRYITKVKNVMVDVVYDPAAGGEFLRMAAAKTQTQAKEQEMDKLEKLLAALKAQRPGEHQKLEGRITAGTVTEDEVMELLMAAPAVNKATDKSAETLKATQEALHETRILACGLTLDRELGASELPVQDKIRTQYTNQVFEADNLKAAITAERDCLAALSKSGQFKGAGEVHILADQRDKAGEMLDDFFEGKVKSFKAAYIQLTGDKQVTGQIKAATSLRGAIDTNTFAELFGDSVTRKMIKDYQNPRNTYLQDWRKIVTVSSISTTRTQRRIRLGGYGNLDIVAQGAPYLEVSTPGDEEATIVPAKRGGLETITLEAIMDDDVGGIRLIPTRLSDAALHTLYEFVFDFIKDNPTIYDSLALFHATHGNLGSAALAAAALTARRQAMAKQAIPDSGKRLGIFPKYVAVPIELDKTAYDLVAKPGDFMPQAADYTRTFGLIPLVVPYWTDATDWSLIADPISVPGIEIDFMNGNEDPELFIQDSPNMGSMFYNDKLTYKIRHWYGGAVLDYRGFDKSVVAG